MGSILYQLEKYKPKSIESAKNEIVVGDDPVKKAADDDLWQLACNILYPEVSRSNVDIWESEVKRVVFLLSDMPKSELAGVLFSREIQGIYHCYYYHQKQVVGEGTTDAFFMSFLRRIDPVEYQAIFEKAADETSKKLAMVRIALATSGGSSLDIVSGCDTHSGEHCTGYTVHQHTKKIDVLPLEFRQPAFEYLGINSIAAAANLQEILTRHATIDQIIIGRMGYLMFWNWNNRGTKSNIPLLAAPRKALK
jgi:hypothetical protein